MDKKDNPSHITYKRNTIKIPHFRSWSSAQNFLCSLISLLIVFFLHIISQEPQCPGSFRPQLRLAYPSDRKTSREPRWKNLLFSVLPFCSGALIPYSKKFLIFLPEKACSSLRYNSSQKRYSPFSSWLFHLLFIVLLPNSPNSPVSFFSCCVLFVSQKCIH